MTDQGNSRGTRRLNDAFDRIRFDNNPIFAQLFLYEYHFLCPLDYKVPSWIQRALSHPSQLGFAASREHTLAAAQHDRQPPDVHISLHDRSPSGVLNRDDDRRAVSDVSQPAFVRRYPLVDCVLVWSLGEADIYVGVFEPEARVDVGGDLVVCLDDVLDIDVHKVVERVNMLLHEALHLQEGRQQQPFVLRSSVR